MFHCNLDQYTVIRTIWFIAVTNSGRTVDFYFCLAIPVVPFMKRYLIEHKITGNDNLRLIQIECCDYARKDANALAECKKITNFPAVKNIDVLNCTTSLPAPRERIDCRAFSRRSTHRLCHSHTHTLIHIEALSHKVICIRNALNTQYIRTGFCRDGDCASKCKSIRIHIFTWFWYHPPLGEQISVK